ncbi:MAG: hypothetical protein ACTSXD_04760 [Candidatus Heimdallarchaeaceae archaeon]
MINKEFCECVKEKIVGITCDICKKDYSDEMELQEFHFVDFVGGYLSVFGDETKVTCEICQHCLYKLIIEYL